MGKRWEKRKEKTANMHTRTWNNETMAAAGVFDETQIGLIYLFWGAQRSIYINKYIIQIHTHTWMLANTLAHTSTYERSSIVGCGCFIASILVHKLERFFVCAQQQSINE